MEPSLDTVPEAELDLDATKAAARPKPPVRRRRANTVHSDGVMAFDQNGHHKPAGKINRASQKNSPYQLSRVNSTTSASSLGTASENPLFDTGAASSFAKRSRAAAAREQRRVKSEAASPLMSASSSFSNLAHGLPPLDLSSIEYPSYLGNSSFEMFGSAAPSEQDTPMFSAGLSAVSVDWSHYDLVEAKSENFAPSSYSQAGAQSVNGPLEFGSCSEQLPHLANTTSTSGDVSEVEDFMGNADADIDAAFGAGGPFMRQPNIVGSSADLSSIDYDSFYTKNTESNVAVGSISMVEEDPAFWMPNYNEGNAEAQDPLVAANSMSSFWEL